MSLHRITKFDACDKVFYTYISVVGKALFSDRRVIRLEV